jgi:hypothetical protein
VTFALCNVDATKADSICRRFATCRTDTLYQNVGKQVPTQYAQHHRMAETSVYVPQHEVCVRMHARSLVVLSNINSSLRYRKCLNFVPSGEVICTYGPQDTSRSKEMFKEPRLLNFVTINTTGESRRVAGGGGV